MKYCAVVLCFILLVSCTEKIQEPRYSNNFEESVVDFAIACPNSKFIELPDLYEKTAGFIPKLKDENMVLADKLIARKFKITVRDSANYNLTGQRTITFLLSRKDCDCEVTKIYRATQYVSDYTVSEKIKCRQKDQ